MIRVVRKGSMSPDIFLEKGGCDWVKGAGGGVVGCHIFEDVLSIEQ